MACERQVDAYDESDSLNNKEAAAKAAAVSAATSDPGLLASILYDGYSYYIYTGATQSPWSIEPLPTWTYNSFFPEWHLMR